MATKVKSRQSRLKEKQEKQQKLIKINTNKKRKRKERDSDIGENPFKADWKFPAKLSFELYYPTNSPTPKRMANANPNEQEDIAKGQFRPYLMDCKFTRVYLEGNGRFRDKVFDLSAGELKLLFYILFNLKSGEDYISIDMKYVMKRFDIGRSTYYSHISKLIEQSIIARTAKKERFFINVQHFFHGTRGYYFPEKCHASDYGDLESMKEAFMTATKNYHNQKQK